MRYRGGCIEIESEPMVVEMVRQGRLTVAVPNSRVPALASNVVEEAREVLERERSQSD